MKSQSNQSCRSDDDNLDNMTLSRFFYFWDLFSKMGL